MTTVADLRASGSILTNVAMPILEPINAQEVFQKKLKRFGDNYNLSNTSHLYRFLVALCGEAGAGANKKELLLPRLEQTLEATHFTDLDLLYGNGLGLARLSTEIYALDPINDILTQTEWGEIAIKDSDYRARCLTWMRAIIEGPTPLGIRLAAEAAIGVECDVVENYKYVENQASSMPLSITNFGQTSSRNEFVIIPREPNITNQEKRRIKRLIDKLRPVNTISSVTDGDYLRNELPVVDVASTSERFQVLRYVTGRPDVQWPPVDTSQGNWIEANVEKEAPTYAFMGRQEAVTYLSITDTSASSLHVGPFNRDQSSLFANLSSNIDSLYQFGPDKAYARSIAPPSISVPWIATDQLPRNQIVVNNNYPVGYFAQPNVEQFITQSAEDFWSSVEALAPSSETLTLDVGLARPMNLVDFEITQKPIDFEIQYSVDGTTWNDVEASSEFPVSLTLSYLPSLENPWHYFEMHFELITARYLRIIFNRREERFPLPTSDYFPWSIDVRGLRIMYVVPSVDTFIPDSGVDVLGNAYRTDVTIQTDDNIIDLNSPAFWESQPNPTRNAVEAVYFDLRTGLNPVTMSYLDRFQVGEINWSQQELDIGHYENGVVIDEIFIDPVTVGPIMNIYYSLDELASWDDKLWMPIPRQYKLKRGFHALSQPTFVKFVKLEFTDLTAMPYQPIEYPNIPPVEFRRFPTWVQNYFENVFPVEPINDNVIQVSNIDIDPLVFGFQQVLDAFDNSSYEVQRITAAEDTTTEVQNFIASVVATQTQSVDPQQQIESHIQVRSPIMWQSDLINQLDATRALSRIAKLPRSGITDTGFNSELGLPISDPPVQQSVVNLAQAYKEKKQSAMFFPQKCRHGYQIVRASFANKIAFHVAIKQVSFYRRDFTIAFDDRIYLETLDDESHIEVNEFSNDGWRYVVSP